MRRTLVAVCILFAAGTVSGCANSKSSTSAAASAKDATPVNAFCVMMPDHPVDPTLTVDYKGEKVAFCCADCVPEFDEADEATKAKLVKEAKANKPKASSDAGHHGSVMGAAGTPINETCPFSGKAINPEVVAVHEGKTIGFCCAGCSTSFAGKSHAEQDALIAKVAKPQ